ncbi:MAG: hypothetical protein IJA12_06940 [Oscillospiraceae bacterium]|nr:hypothetical protein [Oscillospiraceae bacterium]
MNYDDIINLSPPVSKNHKKMPLLSRAVQFAPFSALTGLDEQMNETSRLTDSRRELTDDEKNLLDMNIRIIENNIEYRPSVSIVYFIPDEKKSGGSYHKISGNVRRIEQSDGVMLFEDNQTVNLSDVVFIKIHN